jgi:hypothetical protein
MFQFPGFASLARYPPKRVGCPIRISMDHRLFAPTHSFSQLTTSFVASECLGIHTYTLIYFLPILFLDAYNFLIALFELDDPLFHMSNNPLSLGRTAPGARIRVFPASGRPDFFFSRHHPGQALGFRYVFGGECRSRTDDPLLAKQVL